MKRLVATLTILFTLVPSLVLSQQGSSSGNISSINTDGTSYFESYLEEAQKISEVFTPLYKHLEKEAFINWGDEKIIDYARWENEYYQPLFKLSIKAMRKVVGDEDYLAMWENKIPQTITETLQKESQKDQNSQSSRLRLGCVPYYDLKSSFSERGMQLLYLYTLSIAHEQREEILKGTVYEDSREGAEIRSSKTVYPEIPNPWDFLLFNGDEKRNEIILEMFNAVDVYFFFPPRKGTSIGSAGLAYDFTWDLLTIYSFKSERSEKLLYELALDPDTEPQFADFAIFCLALSPNSSKFLPETKKELTQKIKSFQDAYPQLSEILSTTDGSSLNNSSNEYRRAVYDLSHSKNKDAYVKLDNARRLLSLKRALEFNEKIPESEREHFEIVRRELAISWIIAPKGMRKSPSATVRFKKGEEQFELYLVEYPTPYYESFWEDHSLYPNYEERAKARRDFYARELAKPRSFYTQAQLNYLKERLNTKR